MGNAAARGGWVGASARRCLNACTRLRARGDLAHTAKADVYAGSIAPLLWSSRATNFPKEELDHLRYICLVDDRCARRELAFAPRFGIEDTVKAVHAEW